MKKKILATLALGFLFTGMVSTVNADSIYKEVYIVGSTYAAGLAYDAVYNSLVGKSVIEWTFDDIPTSGWTTLSIIAEGIDLGEVDLVYFNNMSQEIGLLTQQNLYSPSFKLNPGAGALSGTTNLTESLFTVFANKGTNTVRIVVDPDNWVNEIETSTLTPIPEPATMLLFGTGLVGLAAIGRRKRI